MAGGFALAPARLARARPVGDLTARDGFLQRFAVHPGEHQDLAVLGVLRNHRHETVGVELDFIDKTHARPSLASLSKPALRSAIKSAGSSRPTCNRTSGPPRQLVAVRMSAGSEG